jgi:outer membrane protein OmpA-like peptidoglycan-associated protein
MTCNRVCVLCALILAACGSSPPPRQLLDARAAYNKVRAGKAAQYVPADLHTAKEALNAAEQAYEEDAESPETFALAYVALRTAQLTESKANTKAAQGDLARVEQEYDKLQEDEVTRARGELARAKQELDEERQARQDAMKKLAEAAALNVKEEARGTVIVLPGDVLFDSGKSTLTMAAQQKLTLVAGTLAPQSDDHVITVEGHTDSRGSRDLNMQLSQDRAQAVMNYLVSRGVKAEAVTATGAGPDRPIADNSTPSGRQTNRRVEIIVKQGEKR